MSNFVNVRDLKVGDKIPGGSLGHRYALVSTIKENSIWIIYEGKNKAVEIQAKDFHRVGISPNLFSKDIAAIMSHSGHVSEAPERLHIYLYDILKRYDAARSSLGGADALCYARGMWLAENFGLPF